MANCADVRAEWMKHQQRIRKESLGIPQNLSNSLRNGLNIGKESLRILQNRPGIHQNLSESLRNGRSIVKEFLRIAQESVRVP